MRCGVGCRRWFDWFMLWELPVAALEWWGMWSMCGLTIIMVGVGMVGRGGERCIAQAELPVEHGHGVGGGGHGGRGRGGLRRGCYPEGGRHGAGRAGRCHHRNQGAVPLQRWPEQLCPGGWQDQHSGIRGLILGAPKLDEPAGAYRSPQSSTYGVDETGGKRSTPAGILQGSSVGKSGSGGSEPAVIGGDARE